MALFRNEECRHGEMSLSTFGGFVSSQPLEVETLQCTCSISHFWPFCGGFFALQGTLFRWRAVFQLCCLVACFFLFNLADVQMGISINTFLPAKRIDTSAKKHDETEWSTVLKNMKKRTFVKLSWQKTRWSVVKTMTILGRFRPPLRGLKPRASFHDFDFFAFLQTVSYC